MFTKISRYRKVPDVVTVDVQGRQLSSKGLRLLPEVTGSFRHTVQEGDRLDQLAYQYYKQPRKWWHICDANPEFLSPQALLGQDVFVTAAFPLEPVPAGEPDWAALFDALRGIVGVESVRVVENVALMPDRQVVNGQPVMVLVDRFSWVALVTHNRLNVDEGVLADAIAEAGFAPVHPSVTGQLGRAIVIPPDVIG